MSINNKANHILVVIYPFKFTDFVYHKLELDYFEQYCEVEVWDISQITAPNFAKAVSVERSGKTNVKVFSSLRDFIHHIRYLRQQSENKNICIINEVFNNSIIQLVCNLIMRTFLGSKSISILEYCNGGVPISYPNNESVPNEVKHMGFMAKVIHFFRRVSTFSEARKTVSSVIYQRLGSLLASTATHRLVAGFDYLAIAEVKFRKKKRIRIVYGHSEDYSNNLLQKYKSSELDNTPGKIAVYIDGPGPLFAGDYVYFARRMPFTVEVWYPALCRFFDKIEAETGVKIVIAGHYKSKHPPISPHFGNRQVYYGKVREFVQKSEFVITRASTAISYAVIFRKPVLSIYSNQLMEDQTAMYEIRGMATVLGNIPLNIDTSDIKISSLLNVKEDRYKYYEKACLTSSFSSKPNCQIIMEDIMNLQIDPYFLQNI